MNPYQLAFKKTVEVIEQGDDLVLSAPNGNAIRLSKSDPAMRSLVHHLRRGGMNTDSLCDTAVTEAPGTNLARIYYALATFERSAFFIYTLDADGQLLVTLEPFSSRFAWHRVQPGRAYRISRFACLRRIGDAMALETPLGHARLSFEGPRAAMALACLAQPLSVQGLTAAVPGLGESDAAALLAMLASMEAALPCTPEGRVAEDENPALQTWEFHDLFFHTRSRSGRHDSPLGGTYRLQGEIEHPPAVKPSMSERPIVLARPDLAALANEDVSFSRVLESRRSIRTQGARPINAVQLGEFLYRVARVKELHPADPANPRNYAMTLRPCPAGGAMHEMEFYLTVTRCDGIEAGFYHYNPFAHELEHLSELGPDHAALVNDARFASGSQGKPDILITLAARFQRMTWKYQSIAYSVILKNVGALYQQMYLVATAMGLAPCALGAGDSDLLAEATGLAYYSETSVGEFMLSSL